jgi:hypothetical protein
MQSSQGKGSYSLRGRGEREDRALKAYRDRNESLEECISYHLTSNGLFAEWHDITMVMIYAWETGRQFVLDSSRFLYGPQHGWCEFFEPFCRSAGEIQPARVVREFEFNPSAPGRKNPQMLRGRRPRCLSIGDTHLQEWDYIHDFFKRMIFRINPAIQGRVAAHLEPLILPEGYLAVQIRRGDKFGEDIFYPAGLYLQRLGESVQDNTLFVMSDDFRAVEEVERLLEIQGRDTRVVTLAEPAERGFDIRLMRKGKAFTAAGPDDPGPMPTGSLQEHTIRLLAEMIAAANASKFVSTEISFLGKAIKAFSRAPKEVYQLRPEDVTAFTPQALRKEQHILDAYDKVLLIRPGPDPGFFPAVLSALNQLQYAERRAYLPVVDFGQESFGEYYESRLGEDVWSYYFKPVAAYSKADINSMLEDENDRLGPEDIVRLSDSRIERLCHFDARSIYHHTLGRWREDFPANVYSWYEHMRYRGHLAVSKYLRVNDSIRREAEGFWDRHLSGERVLGLHIRGTDLAMAPPVRLEAFMEQIDTWLQHKPFSKLFLVTDQQQYLDSLRYFYGEQLVFQPQLRSWDSRHPRQMSRKTPARLGRLALIDVLLLSRCRFVLRGASCAAEFAHYLRPKLGSHNLVSGVRKYRGLDYTLPEATYRDYPGAWTLVNETPEWTTPNIDSLAGKRIPGA